MRYGYGLDSCWVIKIYHFSLNNSYGNSWVWIILLRNDSSNSLAQPHGHSFWWALDRSETCSGYCNVRSEHMISLQQSLTLRDSYVFDVLQLKCPVQEGSAHPLVACSIFRSSMGGREDFRTIFTVNFSSHWPEAHGKKLEKTNNEQ